MPNVLSPRDLVFTLDIGHKLYHHHIAKTQAQMNLCGCAFVYGVCEGRISRNAAYMLYFM